MHDLERFRTSTPPEHCWRVDHSPVAAHSALRHEGLAVTSARKQRARSPGIVNRAATLQATP
jgi:hypothetical protein